MSTPQLGLSALSIVSPNVPTTLTTLSVDTSVLALVINADTNTLTITITVAEENVTLSNPTLVGGLNQFTGSVDIGTLSGTQTVTIMGSNASSTVTPAQPLVTPPLQFDLLFTASNDAVSIGPPSGVTIYKGTTTCLVQWSTPAYTGFQGVRVQWSTDISGVTVPYADFGSAVTSISSTGNVTVTTPVTSNSATPDPTTPGNTDLVTTTTSQTAAVNYSSASIPYSLVQADVFYVLLTTLVQDPDTNLVYESQASGPFTCGYVNLSVVNPTDFLALQTSSDIATRMITNLTTRRPDLDLTARSEVRDLLINPMALELANMSIREWFGRCCMSISALSQIDNASGNGISDPVASSPVKQQIATAYGLSATAVQTFISSRFDIIGEWAGVPRGGATTSTVMLTFYTYSLPTTVISLPLGIVCATVPDTTSTTSITFITTGAASINPQNAAAYWDPENEWWGVSVPAEAQVAGSTGQVGALTIQNVNSGGPTGISVTNLIASDGGTDQQSNADYAAMIQNRLVGGKDTGSRAGYWNTAMQVPGITNAQIVAAGDVNMLRDWSTVMQKHTYGCVDIYAQGGNTSQQSEAVALAFPPAAATTYGIYSTYQTLTLISASMLNFSIGGFSSLGAPVVAAVEAVAVQGGTTIWLGVQNALFDNVHGVVFLSPTDTTYVVNADGTTTPWQINGLTATNLQFIQAASASSQVTYSMMVQLQAGIDHVPALQPVTGVDGISGPITGAIPSDDIDLVYTTDFLLTGGSNQANDTVTVSGATTVMETGTLTLATATTTIDSNMAITVNAAGVPQNIISVRSSDLSTVYTFGVDYSIVAAGKYGTYALQVLPGSAITTGTTQVVAAYYKYLLTETVTLQTDTLVLTGSTPTALLNLGFIDNTWLPVSHGDTTLMLDGFASTTMAYTGLMGAGVQPTNRYIKVTYSNGLTDVVALEGKDFTLSIDSTTESVTLIRTVGGSIPSGAACTVMYYTLEVLSVLTEYPTFVQQLVNSVAAMKHAAADVLIKAMIPSPVDITMNVVLNSATTPTAVDGRIRTTTDLTVDSASTQLNQAQLVANVIALNGLTNIQLPLLKCAKSDGSYIIGEVIPTGTTWLTLASDPNFAPSLPASTMFISQDVLLEYPTIPSGGPTNAYVGFLYEGQSYRRALSVQDFLTGVQPSFYIIGTDDQITEALPLSSTYSGKLLLSSPTTVTDPSSLAYRCTYQCFGAASANDITVSSAEYLTIGNLQINYVTES